MFRCYFLHFAKDFRVDATPPIKESDNPFSLG